MLVRYWRIAVQAPEHWTLASEVVHAIHSRDMASQCELAVQLVLVQSMHRTPELEVGLAATGNHIGAAVVEG